jgi:sulfide dehydrogenase cytochrome subunit
MPTNPSSRNTCRTCLTALLTAAVLTACGGGGSSAHNETSTDTSRPGTATTTPATPGTTTQTVSAANANGRLLASNCFQCHGTEGTGGFERIRGKSASEVKKYLTMPAGSDIMAAHAQGYTVAQLDAIAAYLNQ